MGFLDFMGLRPPSRIERTATSDFNSPLFEQQVGDFWANLSSVTGASSPTLLDRVWVANRCLHMNANAISTMPLRHYGSRKPAWVANPDPIWFPNGITDAVYAIVSSLYGWGDAFVYVTGRYNDGYPSAWTVLDPAPITVDVRRGKRAYRSGQSPLDADDMVQISRNPQAGNLRGTSAIKAYAASANGLLASSDLGRVMMGSGMPNAVLKPKRKVDATQAAEIQNAWMTATAARRGAPAVIPPDLEFEKLSFSPQELMLLDAQQWDATVLATAFGLPAQLVNLSVEGGLTYQTPALLLQLWWRTELRTTCTRIGEALSHQMLPAGSYVEFDARDFLAPSFEDLAKAYGDLLAAGVITIEELRAVVLGLPPQSAEESLEDLLTPPSAGASPAQQNGNVASSFRPTTSASN